MNGTKLCQAMIRETFLQKKYRWAIIGLDLPKFISHHTTNRRNYSTANGESPEDESSHKNSTVDNTEVDKFSRLASEWWTKSGEFGALHSLNRLRVPLIRDALLQNQDQGNSISPTPLQGFRILDIGCGGGILSEPLARLGAQVTGVDASSENIEVARAHAASDPRLSGRLEYLCSPVEALPASQQYDAVLASELLEHVTNQESFVATACSLVKENGSIHFTTLNKTILSRALAVYAAENVLKIVPAGSHDWEKFITPERLQGMLTNNGFRTVLLHGMTLNPISLRWSWISNTSMNYALHAVKTQSLSSLSESEHDQR